MKKYPFITFTHGFNDNDHDDGGLIIQTNQNYNTVKNVLMEALAMLIKIEKEAKKRKKKR